MAGAAALIGQHRDLVHQVWMLRPAGGMVSVASQTYSVISQSTTASSHDHNCCRSCGVRQVAGSHGRGSNRASPKRGSAPGYRSRHDQVPGTPTPPTFPAPGKAAPTGFRGSRSPVGPGSAAIPRRRASTNAAVARASAVNAALCRSANSARRSCWPASSRARYVRRCSGTAGR